MFVRRLQVLNAFVPILLTLVPMKALVRLAQLANISLPMLVTPLPIEA